MTDNFILPATNDLCASDDVGGVKYQRVKLIHGVDGVNDGDVASINPLPVRVSSQTAFGELSVAETSPQIQLQFPYNVNPRLMSVLSAGTGAATAVNSVLTCSSGTTTGSNVLVRSVRAAKYHPGQGMVARFAGYFDASGTAGTETLIGIGNEGDGLFFGYNGTAFGILHRRQGAVEYQRLTFTAGAVSGAGDITITLDGDATAVTLANNDSVYEVARKVAATTFAGWEVDAIGDTVEFRSHLAEVKSGAFSFVDTDTTGTTASAFSETVTGAAPTETWYAQTAWSEDTADGSGDADNPSGMSLSHDKGNVYQIRFEWLGYGTLEFFMEDPATGNNICVHKIAYPDTSTVPSLQNPTLPLYLSAKNGATTTDVSVHCSSMGVFTEGAISTRQGLNNSQNGQRNGVNFSTETSLLAFRVKRVFQGVENRVEVLPLRLSVAVVANAAAKRHIVRSYVNPVLGGDPVFADVDADSSVVEYDTAGTVITGGDATVETVLGVTDSKEAVVARANIPLSPGTLIVFTIESDGGATDADVTITWRELF